MVVSACGYGILELSICGDLREGQMTGVILGTGALILVDGLSYLARCPDVEIKEKHKQKATIAGAFPYVKHRATTKGKQ
jgi:hypothetical protein